MQGTRSKWSMWSAWGVQLRKHRIYSAHGSHGRLCVCRRPGKAMVGCRRVQKAEGYVLYAMELQSTGSARSATESSGSLQRALKLYRAQKALNAWNGLDVRRGVGGRGRP